MIYEFKVKKALFLLYNDYSITLHNNYSILNIFSKRLEFRVETIDATIFVNAKAKIYYNARHYSLLLNSSNKIYLRLNHKYYLFEKLSKKVLLQRCDPFLVKKRVNRLVYLLELSST
jgi:hypothetical protein